MKFRKLLFTSLLIVTMSCDDSKKASNEFIDTYYGILPCSGCPAIYYELTLNEDFTYTEKSYYFNSEKDTSVIEGNFEVESGYVVLLKDEAEAFRRFKFSGEELTLLDWEKNEDSGSGSPLVLLASKPTPEEVHNILDSSDAIEINDVEPELEGNWILEKLNERIIKNTSSYKTPTIEIEPSSGRLLGNSGCNKYWGGIKQLGGNQVDVFLIEKTKLSCPEADLEVEYLEALTAAILNYKISEEKLLLFNDEVTLIFEKAGNSEI